MLAEAMEAHAEFLGRLPRFRDTGATAEERQEITRRDTKALSAWFSRYRERMDRQNKRWWLSMHTKEIINIIDGSPLVNDMKEELRGLVGCLTSDEGIDCGCLL